MTSVIAGGNMNTVNSSSMMPMTKDTRLYSMIGARRFCNMTPSWWVRRFIP